MGIVLRALAIVVLITAMVSPASAEANRREARRLVQKAATAMSTGDSDGARSDLAKAISVDPDFLPAYDAAIPLWLEAGEIGELVKHLEIATTRHRDYAFAWYTLGYVYRLKGRPELSVIAYETYLQLRPKDPDPRFGLALALLELDKPARAELELQRYLKLERRPERESYIARARELIVEMGGVVPAPLDRTPRTELDRARSLVDGLRFASALAVLDGITSTITSTSDSSDTSRSTSTSEALLGEIWLLRARAHVGAGRPEAAIAAGFVALGYRKNDNEALEALADAFDSLGSAGAVGTYLRSLAEPAR